MNKIHTRLFAIPAVVLAVGIMIGCHGSDSASAQDVTRTFLAGWGRNDHPAIEATVTAASRDNLKKQSFNTPPLRVYTLGAPAVTGDTAVVPVSCAGSTGRPSQWKVNLRREDGQWRVYGIVVTARNGSQFPMDFEHTQLTSN